MRSIHNIGTITTRGPITIKGLLQFGVIALSVFVWVALVQGTSVSAASDTAGIPNNTGCDNPVHAGLYQGANAALGTNYGCTDSSNSTAYSNTSNTTNSSSTSSGSMFTPANGYTSPNTLGGLDRSSNLYVATGDSVAAGAGLPADTQMDPTCGVSSQAYPGYVSASLGLRYVNVACSGATTHNLLNAQSLSGSNHWAGAQLPRAFALGSPSLITITAGANDVYWAHLLGKCYVTICGTASDKSIMFTALSVLQFRLTKALNSIQNRGGTPPTVVLTGYYQPISSACVPLQNGITSSEFTWFSQQNDALNQTLASTAATYSFVRFAPVSFAGHELCSTDPWVQGLQDPAPFHPKY
jgi:lysophospholipase L1-like esterase